MPVKTTPILDTRFGSTLPFMAPARVTVIMSSTRCVDFSTGADILAHQINNALIGLAVTIFPAPFLAILVFLVALVVTKCPTRETILAL